MLQLNRKILKDTEHDAHQNEDLKQREYYI